MLSQIKALAQSLINPAAVKEACVPEGMRIYAVGDIHGRDDLLASLLRKIENHAAANGSLRNVIVYLGDYVDRGLQSRQVLDRLIAGPPADFEAVHLKGNHEEALLQFLQDAQFAKTWKYYGGLETLHSYEVTDLTLSDDPSVFERAREKFDAALPQSHRSFLENLSFSVTFGDYFFAHAGVRPGIGLERQSEHDLMWIRDEFLNSRSNFGKIVVHGHTPREKVEFRANRIGIDTGAYMTNVLTALVLSGPGRELIQVDE
jgi:diadenosine tetraphosphatase ApaH/serine/threonine PP2A family protein phosphatase